MYFELTAWLILKDKKEENEEDDKISKRLRVEDNVPSGSGTASATPDMNTPHNDSMLSKIFGGWFSGGRSQSNPALFSEEISRESANNTDENENIMEEDDELLNPTPTRSRSWW